MVKRKAVQLRVRMEKVSHPRDSHRQLAQLTVSKPHPWGICLSLERFTYSLSFFCLGLRRKPPSTVWHLQLRNSKMAHRAVRAAVTTGELECPEGKKQSSMALSSPNSTQQWKLLMRTRLKGMDSRLKTCTQAVSYSLFTQCKTPKTKATSWTSVQASLLPSRQKRGRMRMGPKYSMQKTCSQRICLPKFFMVSSVVGSLANLRGIWLSESTVLASPTLQESSCWKAGTLVCPSSCFFSAITVSASAMATARVLSLYLTVRLSDISFDYGRYQGSG